ncbi:bifunctional transpeptidase/multidrug ABC transporter permease/ATP-binding protein [Massilia violaceinigra]|uniref:Bifunctional transpeptidase/multidrug ABC transporter permease/ATP-binding protein n=1 Tax=Massilia violaceinigra TaxID=2045208 RepID=A0A2D2DN30_9BURK|nr:serine hydrolase [Massilia violaceinigra]ATQ76361.1 bifunctional transpeptidase/multidrug ABC transporter permease/ATP-binding protein [Massilia violaceinigra]
MNKVGLSRFVAVVISLCLNLSVYAAPAANPRPNLNQMIGELRQRWDSSQVPTGGLSVVVGNEVHTLRLGKAEPGAFELASCSKAVTGLLIAMLEREGRLSRDDAITRWVPELAENPKTGYAAVRLSNLLSHTSGLSADTLDLLRPDSGGDALARLPLLLKDVPLAHAVGSREEYATLNYSLLGLVAERATGKPFAVLLRERIFQPLGMRHTFVDGDPAPEALERVPGYKIGFASARSYAAPRYRQNTPAGYVISTPEDMARWLQFLLRPTPAAGSDERLAALYAAREVAKRPSAVGYAYGWDVETGKTTSWSHPGQNPNGSAYVAFDPQSGVGVSLLGNSNSPQVVDLGRAVFEHLRNTTPRPLPHRQVADSGDLVASGLAALYWLGGLLLLPLWLLRGRWSAPTGSKDGGELASRLEATIIQESLVQSAEKESWLAFTGRLLIRNLALILMLVTAPTLALGLNWPNLLVWGPPSLPMAAAGLFFLANAISLFFFLAARHSDSFGRKTFSSLMVAKVVGLTVLSGLLNSALILCILQAIDGRSAGLLPNAGLLLCCIYFYIVSRKAAEQQIMHFGHAFVQGWRMEIIRRLLAADYRSLERLSPGKIQAVIGEDSQELAKSVLAFVPFFTNLLTIIFLFAYLMAFKSMAATALLLACTLPMIALYYYVSERADRIMPQALQSRSEFMDTVEDLQKGYKGLRREVVRRAFYQHALAVSERFKQFRIRYDRGFLGAFFVGESLLTTLLVAVALLFPFMIAGFDSVIAKEYLIILLYLIGPLNAVMAAVPELVRLQSLRRSMAEFSQSIHPAATSPLGPMPAKIRTLELSAVRFRYPSAGNEGECFGIGPVSLKAECGKAYFLTGGNGSGKSTLAMILAGLYAPEQGTLKIDGAVVSSCQLQELTRTIFSDNWLLRRVYDPALLQLRAAINHNIAALGLADKTALNADGTFDNISLSTGQRKRLSLAMLLADPSPLVVLDEWAADQDPRAKAVFYREWLPLLRAQGRIIFVVTHDDEYFAEADALITMKNGQLIESKIGKVESHAY